MGQCPTSAGLMRCLKIWPMSNQLESNIPTCWPYPIFVGYLYEFGVNPQYPAEKLLFCMLIPPLIQKFNYHTLWDSVHIVAMTQVVFSEHRAPSQIHRFTFILGVFSTFRHTHICWADVSHQTSPTNTSQILNIDHNRIIFHSSLINPIIVPKLSQYGQYQCDFSYTPGPHPGQVSVSTLRSPTAPPSAHSPVIADQQETIDFPTTFTKYGVL